MIAPQIPDDAGIRLPRLSSIGPLDNVPLARNPVWRAFACALGAAVLLAACGEAAREAVPLAQRDSAGIQIADNTQPTWTVNDVLTLSAAPSLVIGAGGGTEYDLSAVAGAARLADGRIVIADGGSRQLRFYDAAAVFLHAAGGRGSGPGELEAMTRFDRLSGDTLAVLASPSSASVFDDQGRFLNRLELRTLPLDLPGFPAIVLPLAGGSYLLGSAGLTEPRGPGERWIDSMPLALLGPDSTVRHRLGRFPAFDVVMGEDGPRPPWFGAVAAFAAVDSSFFWGFGNEYTIRKYSSSGQLERLIRRRWTPVPVAAADIDRFVEEWSERWVRSSGAEAEKERRELRDAPYVETVPAFSQLIADRDGRLWVRAANLADASAAGALNGYPVDPSVWSVFDQDGRWLGDVTMPPRFSPKDIGPDYVLGVARDSFDVQTVVQFDLRAGGGGR